MQGKTVAKALTILSPSILLRALGMDLFIPCLPTVVAYFAAPLSVTQWVMSIYFLGAGLGQLFFGPLSDLYGRRKVLLASTFLFMISSLACTQTTAVWQLIITRLFQGLGACGTTVVTMAIVRDIFDDHTTPKAYSYLTGVIALAPILAPFFGGNLLVWTDSWRTGFYFVTVFSFAAFIINYLYVKESNPNLTAVRPKNFMLKFLREYRAIYTNSHFWKYAYCGITGVSALIMFFSLSSIILIKLLGIHETIFGYYFGFNFIIYFLGNIFSPKLQQRFGINNVIMFAACLHVLGALMMFISDWQFGLNTYSFLAAMLVITSGVGLMFGPCMAGGVRPFKHIAGIASAAYGTLIYGASGLISSIVLQFPINNSQTYAIAMLLLGTVNLLVLSNLLPFHTRGAESTS